MESSRMPWYIWALIPCLIFTLWMYTSFMASNFPTLRGKKIALLIAHPDDEAMFFAPTLLALTNPVLENHVKILCLSSGNADGLGEVRKKELIASALTLGIKSRDDVAVIEDSTNFPDSMSVNWESKPLTKVLLAQFAPEMAKLNSKKSPKANIDVLITFDRYGISSHPNHKSLYLGAKAFLRDMMRQHSGWDCPIKMYTLTTTNTLRKYMAIFDSLASVLDVIFSRKQEGDFPSPLFFVSTPTDYMTAQTAMTKGHKSQMVWFRWGWITMSRYMIINTVRKEKKI